MILDLIGGLGLLLLVANYALSLKTKKWFWHGGMLCALVLFIYTGLIKDWISCAANLFIMIVCAINIWDGRIV